MKIPNACIVVAYLVRAAAVRFQAQVTLGLFVPDKVFASGGEVIE
jgi:hypothetical protein